MRALTRMRTLAAACALLLVIAGMAAANAPGRPIDRPEGPPPSPTEVGDPDAGHDMPIAVVIGGHVFIWRLPIMLWPSRDGVAARAPRFELRKVRR